MPRAGNIFGTASITEGCEKLLVLKYSEKSETVDETLGRSCISAKDTIVAVLFEKE